MLVSQGFAIMFTTIFLLMLFTDKYMIKLLYIVLVLFMFVDAIMSDYTFFDLGIITIMGFVGLDNMIKSRIDNKSVLEGDKNARKKY